MKEKFERFMSDEHIGRKKAITSKEIENAFQCKGTEVRKIVNELRSNGVPICSLPIGYYYAETKSEIKDTLAHLESRIKKIEKAKEGMEETLKTYDEYSRRIND